VLLEQHADLGVLDPLHQLMADQGRAGHLDLFAVTQQAGGGEQRAHVVGGVEDLGHAAIDAEQLVGRFHPGAHRVLDGEDRVPGGCLGELAEEREVDSAGRDHVGPVTGLPGHEERRDVGHHHRHAGGSVRRELGDVGHGDTHVIEPLLGDLLAGALLHRLLHVVAWDVDEQRVHPDHDLVLGLLLEVRLAVDGPTEQPGGVLGGDDPAGDGPALNGSRLAIFSM